MRRWPHPWVTCVSARASQQCQHIPGDAGSFPKKGLQRLNRAGQKKNLWNMSELWLLPSDVRSSEYSTPILSYLTSFETSSLLPSFYYASRFRVFCCNFSLVFLSSEFWVGGELCEFFSPRGIRNGVTLCVTKHLHHHRKGKEASALVYITHSYI